jgi:hypothetical protein
MKERRSLVPRLFVGGPWSRRFLRNSPASEPLALQ